MKKIIIFCLILLIPYLSFTQTINKNDYKSISDSIVWELVSEINGDSLSSYIQSLQDFGTRFCLAPNRRDIAVWIKNKFISFGYINTVLDSFLVIKDWGFGDGQYDTLWHYNVIATLEGSINSNIQNVICGHYDSVTPNNYLTTAPGADDNASGTSAVIEVARVMKMINILPQYSIKFVAFASEEAGFLGSNYFVSQYPNNGYEINMCVNLDMIAYNSTASNWKVNLGNYLGSEWLTNLASIECSKYTLLSPVNTSQNINLTDSYEFFLAGFPVINLQEVEVWTNPFYHTPGDTIGNCNIPYCVEITKLAISMIAETSICPSVKNIDATPNGTKILLTWDKNKENQLLGYNLYRSDTTKKHFKMINSIPILINDTTYTDSTVHPLVEYFYGVTTIDSLGYESPIMKMDSATIITKNMGLLIVDDSYNELLSPSDSTVDAFYDSLFKNFQHTSYDIKANDPIYLSTLGKYSVVFWHTDKYLATSKFYILKNEIAQYLKQGGKLLFTTDRYSATIEHNTSLHKTFYSGSVIYDYFKTDSIYSTSSSRFIGAKPTQIGYPNLEIDNLKTPTSNNHHLSLIEALFPRQDATAIYTYNTLFDSTMVTGALKGLSVGIEYLGNDFKFIALSFPLWYIKQDEAKTFIDYVMLNKFNDPQNVQNLSSEKSKFHLSCLPNPMSSKSEIKYYISENSFVNIEIISLTGTKIITIVNQKQRAGYYSLPFYAGNLKSGIYFCRMKTDFGIESLKLIIINK